MCCIFGIGLLKDHKLRDKDLLIGLVSTMAKKAEVGGRQAAGVSLMREKTAHVLKRPISAGELVRSDEYQQFMEDEVVLDNSENQLKSIIGHTRFPTKGDKRNNNNNHPIIVNHIIGIHNGMIGNDDHLFRHFSMLDRIAEVDTEIIFQLVAHFANRFDESTVDAIGKSTLYLKGSYACALQNANHPYNLYLFRKGNPIRVVKVKSLGVVFFATRLSFITETLEGMEDKLDFEEIELPSESGMALNLEEKTFAKFLFPRGAV